MHCTLFLLFAQVTYREQKLSVFFFWCLLCCRFDAVIISSEVGSEKPDANIFKAALGIYSTTIYSVVLYVEWFFFII